MTQVLDHGYVNFIEHWGSDERIIESARMSTDGSFRGWGPIQCTNSVEYLDKTYYCRNGHFRVDDIPNLVECSICKGTGYIPGDEKLLKYLYTHSHMTPFEMAGLTIEVQAPIFVFREWHRHRTQSYNELSARYTPIPNLHYIPSVERLMMGGGPNKQAQGTGAAMNEEVASAFRQYLEESYTLTNEIYEQALAQGIPKELARLVMPVGRYSRMRASANLRNWLAFMTLRCDSNAQWEIRQYAWEVAGIIEKLFPRTYQLWNVGGPTIKSRGELIG